jgi:hypothetical protein
MKTIIIKNTSRYPDNAVRWLVHFAARYVRGEMTRMGDLEKFDRHGFWLQFKNKTCHYYGGRYFNQLVNSRGGYPLQDDEQFRRVMVKIGKPEKFPMQSWDPRYKDMPEGRLNDWQEATIAITAHELCHVKYNGRKEGEYNCDTIMHDAVDAFRKSRILFDEAMDAGQRKEQERETAAAAKRSPEAVLNQRLIKAQAQLARWTRRQKIAGTKVKLYEREVKRLAKRQSFGI